MYIHSSININSTAHHLDNVFLRGGGGFLVSVFFFPGGICLARTDGSCARASPLEICTMRTALSLFAQHLTKSANVGSG